MSDLTMTDLFCGAGGSSTGAVAIQGVRVRMAANHWKLATDSHNANFPDTDHDCADISQVDPRRYPTTAILWASPECTWHSQARGQARQDPQLTLDEERPLPSEASERSRATMWDVPRFTEYHRYQAVIVENVVDAFHWPPFQSWLGAMDSYGYDHQIVWLNSMHAQGAGLPAPQSRDRMYVVFWRRGNRRPDLAKWTRPQAWCPTCEQMVRAMQVFKRHDRPNHGRYRQQYVYRCPSAKCRNQVVEPAWLPAAAAIDWALRGQRIGDRAKPLAAKTRKRIAAGLTRFARPIHLEAAGNTYDAASRGGTYWRAWPVDQVLATQHTTSSKGIAYGPLMVPVEGRDGKTAQPVTAALRTQTARNETGLLVPAGGTWNDEARPTDEPMRTRTTRETEGLLVPPFITELRGGGSTARETSEPLATVTAAGNHHGLLVPYYGHATARETTQPHGTLPTRDRYALVMRNNTARGDQGQMSTPVSEPLRTLTTTGHQSLLEFEIPDVDDCLFRMLEPHEIALAMAFPDRYLLFGNKREKVRLCGNAVTPPAARDLIAAVAESLGQEVAA